MRVLDGRFEIGDPLGRGGMAVVFEATDLRLDRRVAVKVLSLGLRDEAARRRFEREARALSRLVHPNAVVIFDAGLEGDQPYLVMELVRGPTLAEYLRSRRRLPVRQAAVIASEVLSALTAAHEQGIVHRDVKPSNIILGADGRVRLADFGIAKSIADAGADLTATGLVVGTASYLAPEVAAGQPAGPASDQYSVGVVLFEMLTGTLPFEGDSPIATLVARNAVAAPSTRTRRADVPLALDAAVARALEREPSGRFAGAAEMRDAVSAAVSDPIVVPDAEATQPVESVVTSAYPATHASVTEVSATGEADASSPAVAPRPTTKRRRTRRRAVLLMGLIAVLTVAAAGAWAAVTDGWFGSGGSPVGAADPSVTTVARVRTQTPSTGPAITTPRVTQPRTPQTLTELAALLGDPAIHAGTQQLALREGILGVLATTPGHARQQAFALAGVVRRWAATGQLNQTIAGEAIALLDNAVADPAPQHGPKRGGKHNAERD